MNAIALIAGGVTLVAGIVVLAFAPQLRGTAVLLVAVGAGVVSLSALSAALGVRTAVGRRRRQYGANTAVMIAAVVGIAFVVNLGVIRNEARLDLTSTRQFSLAPQTVSVLAELDQDIEVTAFYVERFVALDTLQSTLRERSADLLREFGRLSGGKVTHRFVDPEVDPVAATDKGLSQFPATVFEGAVSGRRYEVPPAVNLEQAFLTGLLVAGGVDQKRIYILTGHSERVLTGDGTEGYGLVQTGLEGDSYLVESLNLLETGGIPEDAATVIAAAPRQDLTPEESAAIDGYLRSGGRVVFLLEPYAPPTWRRLALQWGIRVMDGYVIDPDSHVTGLPAAPIIRPDQYASPRITGDLDTTFFPGLAPLGLAMDPSNMPNVVDLELIAITTASSFAAGDPDQPVRLPEDAPGPFIVGAIVRAVAPIDEPAPQDAADLATLAVFGDSDFAADRYFYVSANGDLFLNTINEVAGDAALISVRSKPLVFRGAVMTPAQFDAIRYTGWLLLPLLVALVGVAVWWRRR